MIKTRNLVIPFLAIACVLVLTAGVSASEMTTDYTVEVNKMDVNSAEVAVIAGETISIDFYFTSSVNASDVRVEAEIEGQKIDNSVKSGPMDVEKGRRYSVRLDLKVPTELKDESSDSANLNIKVWNNQYKTEDSWTVRVQRPSYDIDVMSISTQQTVEAGETLAVDVAIKNVGYNYLDDVYVTVSIPALGVEKTSYFGDIVSYECTDDDDPDCDDDDTDVLRGRFYLDVPYNAQAGTYTLEVEAKNSDITMNAVKQISVNNDFSTGNVVVASTRKVVGVGDTAQYDLVIVNPTDKVKVYRIVVESSGSVESSVNEAIVAVPAGSSKSVTVSAEADAKGEYVFDVSVFSGETLVSTVALTLDTTGKSTSGSTTSVSAVMVLTIVLVVIFVVLLIALIVLLTKKQPEKSEEFGESYY